MNGLFQPKPIFRYTFGFLGDQRCHCFIWSCSFMCVCVCVGGKTHLISQRLSLNMPSLNQNQRIQTLPILARGHNVSTSVEHSVVTETQWFGCASVSSKQVGWQIAVDPVDWGLQTLEQTGSLRWRTFNVVFKWWQVLQGSTVSANSVAPPQASLATHSSKKALCGTNAYSTSSCCPVAVGTTAFPFGATAVGSGSILWWV